LPSYSQMVYVKHIRCPDLSIMLAPSAGFIALLFVHNSASIARRVCLILLTIATLVTAWSRAGYYESEFSSNVDEMKEQMEYCETAPISTMRRYKLIKNEKINGSIDQFCALYTSKNGHYSEFDLLCVPQEKHCDGIIDMPWRDVGLCTKESTYISTQQVGPADEAFCPNLVSFALSATEVSLWIVAAISCFIIFAAAIGCKGASGFVGGHVETVRSSGISGLWRKARGNKAFYQKEEGLEEDF